MRRAPSAPRPGAGEAQDTALTEHERTVLRSARRKTRVRIGGEASDITMTEAVLAKTAQAALEGNSHAQWLFLDQAERAEARDRARIDGELEFGARYKARCMAELRAARQRGEPEPLILPHPDDIELDRERGIRVMGPATPEHYRACQQTVRLRDALILQQALDWRLSGRDGGRGPGSAMLLATLGNCALPKRMRLADAQVVNRLMSLRSLSRREFLRRSYRAWKVAAIDLRRGTSSPNPGQVERLAQICVDALRALEGGGRDQHRLTRILGDVANELTSDLPEWRARRAGGRPELG